MEAAGEPMKAVGSMCSTEPFLEPLAFGLLDDIRAAFQDPATEAEFQAWLEDPEKVRAAWRARTCA